jgi:glycosyltransferase involved in cell wall biosynthesis
MKVAYSPYSTSLDAPGDKRRFCFFAGRRGIEFELADPRQRYDVVVLSEWADITAWSRCPRPTRIIFDIIDSYLALPRLGVKQIGRGVVKRIAGQTSRLALDYRKAVEAMCRRADAVVCATQEQRAKLLELCPNVHVILDYPSDVRLEPKLDYRAAKPFTLVWEGLPYTLGAFAEIADVIRDLARTRDTQLRVITDLKYYAYARRFGKRRSEDILRRLFDDYEIYEWDAQRLPSQIRECDLAVIPILVRDPLARGKPENKLLHFWRMGMPTVTSATPAYVRAMTAAGLDLTCDSPASWQRKLTVLIDDENERREAGQTGLAFVTATQSAEQVLAQWDELWASVTT